MKKSSFAGFACAIFISVHFPVVLTNLWCEMTYFAVVWTTLVHDNKFSMCSSPNCLYNFNSRIIGTHFAGIMTGKYREFFSETQRYIFGWCSSSWWHRPCLSFLRSLLIGCLHGMIVWFSHFIGNYFNELKYILAFQAAKLNKAIMITIICRWWSTVKGPSELQHNYYVNSKLNDAKSP